MKKFFHTLATLIIIGNLVLIALAGYWMLKDYKMPDVKQPIEILNEGDKIAIGEKIRMRLEVNKPQTYDLHTSHYLKCTSGNLVTLVGNGKNLPIGEFVFVNDEFVLPPKVLSNDECVFVFKNQYKVNPLRIITKEWVSEPFVVL